MSANPCPWRTLFVLRCSKHHVCCLLALTCNHTSSFCEKTEFCEFAQFQRCMCFMYCSEKRTDRCCRPTQHKLGFLLRRIVFLFNFHHNHNHTASCPVGVGAGISHNAGVVIRGDFFSSSFVLPFFCIDFFISPCLPHGHIHFPPQYLLSFLFSSSRCFARLFFCFSVNGP